jgi:hypothetical protein
MKIYSLGRHSLVFVFLINADLPISLVSTVTCLTQNQKERVLCALRTNQAQL